MLIPSGPSAMLLANVAELVDVDQGPIAGYLTISVRTMRSCNHVSLIESPSSIVFVLASHGYRDQSWISRCGKRE